MNRKKNKKIADNASIGFSVFKLNSQAPPPMPSYGDDRTYPAFIRNPRGWVTYGKNNLFPQDIINLNNESAINKAIIENKVTYICGKGVNEKNYANKPNLKETWDVFIEKVSRDYVTFGGFCFQVILNENKESVSLFHTDFSKIRVGETNDYGVVEDFYISNDWTKTSGHYAPVNIKAYGSEKMKKGTPYLLYYKDYEPNLEYYPIPSYYSAFNYIEADGLLGKFYRNSINNGFAPSVIVTIPSNPSDEAKEQFNRDMAATFAGTNGANSIVVLYGESQDIKPEVTPFIASDNADLYNNVNDVIFQKIISAHSLTSPTLAGLSGSGSLSGNANEIINSFILYNATVIQKLRRKILDTINLFVVNNGYNKLEIIDLSIANDIKGETQEDTQEEISAIPESTETDNNEIV